MTSNPAECFVYITLPGDVSAVTAGKFVLEETRQGDPLGRFVCVLYLPEVERPNATVTLHWQVR